MLNLKIGEELRLYFNHKEHKARIIQIEFGEIVWVQFEDESAKQEYFHMDELKELMQPDHIHQDNENIGEELGLLKF